MKRVVIQCTDGAVAEAVVVDITPGYAKTLLRRMREVRNSESSEEFGRLYRENQAVYIRRLVAKKMAGITDEMTGDPADGAIANRHHVVIPVQAEGAWRGPISPTYGSESIQVSEDGVSWFAQDSASFQTAMSVLLPAKVIRHLAGEESDGDQ